MLHSLVLATALLVAGPSAPIGAAPIMGCHPLLPLPGDTGLEPRPIIVLDDEVFEGEIDALDPADIHRIEVLCWNPETRRFARGGIGVVHVTTKAAIEAPRERLARLLERQDQFYEEHGTFAETLAGLGLSNEDGSVTFAADASGWSASAPGTTVPARCRVFDGDAEPPRAGMPRGEIECRADPSVHLPAIGALYDELVASKAR